MLDGFHDFGFDASPADPVVFRYRHFIAEDPYTADAPDFKQGPGQGMVFRRLRVGKRTAGSGREEGFIQYEHNGIFVAGGLDRTSVV